VSRTYGDRGDKDNKIRMLKRQADSLKRENTRLRRDLEKAQGMIDDLLAESPDHTEHEDKKARKRGDSLVCDNCQKGVYVPLNIKLRDGTQKTYLTCNVCRDSKAQK
jgi:hypothetical protein